MEPFDPVTVEETLDPEDWQAMRALGHRMIEDLMDYLETVRERPVWKPIPGDVKDFLKQPAPMDPEPADEVYKDFREYVMPHPMGNIHPRFWGWVMGNGTALGAMADMLAAGMNPNQGGGEHVANYVEAQVLDWMKAALGFPQGASGLLVSGGSMANLVGAAVARTTHAGYDVRTQGLRAGPRQMTAYASAETHSSVQKAIELMGLGSQYLRKIPVNAEFQIDLDALRTAVAEDRQAGLQPFLVIGNAGTVNTGALDDLDALAGICRSEKLWFHVDGAFGGLVALSPDLSHLVKGMEKADSLAFDLHKWMYVPFEAGCILVRSEEAHRQAFSLTPEYLSHGGDRGVAAGSMWFTDYGVQLTRGFRALKVWMSIKEHGLRKYGRMIRQNVDQARYLASLVDAAPELERLAPVPLNIVCFRYNPGGLDDEALNHMNKELLVRLHESGVAVPTYTTLDGKYALRAAITNHRSRREDFDILVQAVTRLGEELAPG